MKTYAVTIRTIITGTGLVQAETIQEAVQKALDECGAWDLEPLDAHATAVEEVDE